MVASLKFVDSIASSPTTRLDLNDLTTWGMGPETQFPYPPLNRSTSSSPAADGAPPGASAFGNREINLVLKLFPNAADTAATALQTMQRELNRTTNILRYQPNGATSPVFFRTYRSVPDSIRWEPAIKEVHASLLAEPFALGLREDLGPFTINNDPANATNGCKLDLTGGNAIKGDVEALLLIDYNDTGVTAEEHGLAIGVRYGASPYPFLFTQAESMTPGTDTSVTADATFSGGSKLRTTFATQTAMASRITGWIGTGAAGAEGRGAYRLFARVKKTVAGDNITMQVRPGGGSTITTPAPVTVPATTNAVLVDFGTIHFGNTMPEYAGYGIAPLSFQASTGFSSLAVDIGRASGTGSLDIDYFIIVPAGQWYSSWSSFLTYTGNVGVVDGINDAVYAATLSGVVPTSTPAANPPARVGGLPRLYPGDNRLVIVIPNPASAGANSLTTALTMNLHYWPRYTFVRPATT